MIKNIEYKYLLVIIYTVVLFLDRLDISIVNVSLPTLAHYFHAGINLTQWVSTAFLLALAISIPISGWLGDRFGMKKVFIIAISLYGLSSVLCAVVPFIYGIFVLRFIQGIGGGMLIPVGMTMVYRAFHPSEYAHITAITFLPSLLAPALAPFIGGIILQYADWQWIFLLPGPICLGIIIASKVLMKEQKQAVEPLDWGGFILGAVFFILLLYSISSLDKVGIDYTNGGLIFLTIAIGMYLLYYEKHTANPLINLQYFKSRLFVQANLIQLSYQICHYGAILLIAAYLERGLGFSALYTGLIIGLQALGAMLGCRTSPKLFNRFGPGLPLSIGLLGIALTTPLLLVLNSSDQVAVAGAILIVRGVFIGLCGPAIQTAGIIDFGKIKVSRVSALFIAGRQISISLGVCISSLLISYGLYQSQATLESIDPTTAYNIFHYAFYMLSIVAIMGLLISSTINNQAILRKIHSN